MFTGLTLSVENYDALLIGWQEQIHNNNVSFSGGNSQYCNGGIARNTLTGLDRWIITDGGLSTDCNPTLSENDFVTTWKTDNTGTSNSTSIEIPTFSGETYNYDVDWNNDGIFDELGITGNVTHDFGTAGTYTIRIQGNFPHIYFNNELDKDKILSVNQWGNQEWISMENAFYGCTNFTGDFTDIPNLTHTTSLSGAFRSSTNFNQPLNDWSTENVNNMSRMFERASNFNQPLNSWNTSNVTNMLYMFWVAKVFNQPLNNWNISNVTNMSSMFSGANNFNQPLNNWDTSNVTDMSGLFWGATNFNQSLNNWDTSNVTNMGSIFSRTNYFNQPLDNWDTSKVINMHHMFAYSVFNQDISSWNISSLTSAHYMFGSSTLSQENYDALLIGWQEQTHNNDVSFSGGNSQYCQGEAARNILSNTDGWIITDGGLSIDCNNNVAQTYVPDNNFEDYLETHDIDGNVVTIGALNSMGNGIANDDYVTTSNINTVTILNVNSKNIADLTGIEDFTNIKSLNCSYNNISEINLIRNEDLVEFICFKNELIKLDLSFNKSLKYIDCRANDLESLNIQNGNNINITDKYFIINENRYLTCVEVDDPNRSEEVWTQIDENVSFSLNCQSQFLHKTEKLLASNYSDNSILIKTKNNSLIEQVKIYNISGNLLVSYNKTGTSLIIPTYVNRGTLLLINTTLKNGKILKTKFIKL